MAPPLLSIVTVTGNRDPLPALELSIANNRRDDIEWVVADNRSSAGIQPEEIAGVPIRWISAPAGDGNAALNRGAAAALGLIVLPLIAGDILHTGAISRLLNEWQRIPAERKARYSGVTAIVNVGPSTRALPSEVIDAEPSAIRYDRNWAGEPLFTIKVELLRARPLPLPGDELPPLALLWRLAGRGFTTHAIDAELATRELPSERSARSRRYEALSALTHDVGHYKNNRAAFRNAAIDYQIASSELDISLRRQLRDLNEETGRALWFSSWLPGRKRNRLAAIQSESTPPGAQPLRPSRGKALFIVSSLDPPVAGQLVSTAIGLHHRQDNSRVIALDAGALERELRDAGVDPVMIAPRPSWQLPQFLWELRSHIRAERPAVIASSGSAANLAALALRPLHRTRIVWTLSPDSDEGLARSGVRRIERHLSRFVSAVVTSNQSEFDRAVAEGYAPERLRLVPTGIDLDKLRFDPEGRNAHRAAWRVTDRAPLIGTVARVVPSADHETFLKAAVIVGRARPDARFICIGGGPNARIAEMQQLSRTQGLGDRVIWTGAITTSASVYSALDICISTATSANGFPEAIAEAMACGTSVIATDVGETAWLIGDDRAIVLVGDAEALAERILAMLADLDAGLADPATLRARVARELSVDRLLDRMEAILFD